MTERSPPLLEGLLQSAPFGMSVMSAAGETVFSNKIAMAAASGAEENSERSRSCLSFDLEEKGERFVVTLSLDNSEQRSVEDHLFKLAYFDELTKLPNRSLIEKVINDLVAKKHSSFALAFLDLDGFKNINDFYGHAVGDELLEQFARRISAILRSTDMLARQSGDEFLLLLSDRQDEAELGELLKQIAEALRAPYYIDGYEIFSSASVGISRFPEDGASYNDLVSSADRAMYRGKKAKKGTIQFFDASIEHVAAERSRLEQRLRLAIRDRRLCCAYQPKVEFRTGVWSALKF